jgi:simple sugar transport system permease protein
MSPASPDLFSTLPFWAAVLGIATPLVFGTLGASICGRVGVLNLGIEGIMVAGAFAGWLTVYQGGGPWSGVLMAAVVGALLGALHGWLTIGLALSPP